MQKLFIKHKIVDYNSLLDMKEDVDGTLVDAEVWSPKGGNKNKQARSTKLKRFIKPYDYPDICMQLITLVNKWNPDKLNLEHMVWEFNYLIYTEGDHFKRHRDRMKQNNRPDRLYSTSTLISQSADFEGGELIIYDDDDNPTNTDLQVGETAFFDSMTPHQVNPVTKGTREVLVAWIYKKEDVQKYKNII
tara:strand:- start:967 stop:1536 length:570 start_codon:yes stop_codon:yes gene_type:complete